MAFDRFAQDYFKNGLVQFNAANELIKLAHIKRNMSILDIGCGEGKVTKQLKQLTDNIVVGIDQSNNMISLAKEKFAHDGIDFRKVSVEKMKELGKFDMIFCNSVFHWLPHHHSFLHNAYHILNKQGIFALQTPSSSRWCPFINDALDQTLLSSALSNIGKCYKTPWTYFETEEQYTNLFTSVGFEVTHCKIIEIPMRCTIEEIMGIFDSGSSAAFFDQNNYSCAIDESYEKLFRIILKENIAKMASSTLINIEFKRLFLIAKKIGEL